MVCHRKLRRAGAGRGASCFALALLFLGTQGCAPDPPRPNVVVVMIDTLRPDHLGFHGHGTDTAPFLSELAQRATVFENAYSTSCWTAPSTASLFTGLYPPEHGVEVGFFANKRQQKSLAQGEGAEMALRTLPTNRDTLPEMFQESGYRTLGITANFNIGSQMGFDRGFDRFEYLAGLGANGNLFMNADGVEETLKKWDAELGDGVPTMLYLHLNDVHLPRHARDPYYVPPGAGELEDEARYDSEIGFLDAILKRMYARYGWDENTIIVVLSDHGEEFLEHGGEGHGRSLYREVNRVLLMLMGPGVAEGRRVEVNVSLIDVLPTLADLIGAPRPEHQRGRSLEPLLGASLTSAAFEERTLFASWKNPNYNERALQGSPAATREIWSAMRGNWRLIKRDETHGVQVELYDAVLDPGEQRNLLATQPDVAQELLGHLDLFQRHVLPADGATTGIELDAEKLRALRLLGYAGGDEEEGE